MATSLGPLTKTFTPPAGCLGTAIWQLPNFPETDSYFLKGAPSVASCFPENYDPHTTASYVPGVCPYEYTAVRFREKETYSTTGVLTCCPTHASFEARETSQDNPFMSTMACQSFFGITGETDATIMSGTNQMVTRVTWEVGDVLNAYGIIIVPATNTAVQTSTPNPSRSSSPSPSQSLSSNGLSTAAKGGIGGGIAALLLLALGGAWVFFKRQKRKRALLVNLNNGPSAYNDEIATHHAHKGIHGQSEPSAGEEMLELAASKHMPELPAGREAHELHT